ncbi:MAG: putative DNA binding domain-containing protein [Deltaproteobacteria bacterium]|nr:putative DNA binding domain-containing protein [Deltaproteobacteria bacterium]
MKEKTLTEAEVYDLSSRQEGHFYDRKAKEIDGRGIQKVAVAFANTDGGDFVVGIKDDKSEPDPNKRWDGFPKIEDYNKIFQNLQGIRPSISMSATFLFDPKTKTYVVQITIEKSEKVHSTTDETVYVRRSAQSIPLKDPQKIQELSFAKGESSYEDVVCNLARAEDIFESGEMRKFLDEYSPKSDPIDFTLNQNLVDRITYYPKMAGLLLFSDNPAVLLPKKCGIKISRYDTSESEPEREHLKEQRSIEGCLYTQIHKAVTEVQEIISNVKIWTHIGMEKVSYPPEAIWEILVNAVIHRDYSISDDVHVLIFNNRVEIISPGKFPGYVNENNILNARYSRNPKIVRTLNRYKDPPNKDMGEGLNTAFQKMKEWKLRDPVVKEEHNSVRVVVSHTPLASPEESIMEYLNTNPTIRNREARKITNIKSENSMKRVFYRLKDRGEIEPVYAKTGKKIVAWKKKEK